MFRQDIKNLSHICVSAGIKHVVIAPGSRSAPITMAFASEPELRLHPVTDERSAGFFALGIAQYSHEPVALVCTSGSAVLNFAPSIVEAYYQHLPLVILTADRPTAWIDRADGQTIRQPHIYQNFIKASFHLPSENTRSETLHSDRIISQAIDLALQFPRGPVHINIPLDEPLYAPLPSFHTSPRVIRTLPTEVKPASTTLTHFLETWKAAGKRMILVGIGTPNAALESLLQTLAIHSETLVVTENLSNISGRHFVTTPDVFFASLNETEKQFLQPDLIISIGHSLISKHLKQFVRKYPPKEFWQLHSELPYADTYQCLQYIVPVEADLLLNSLISPSTQTTLASVATTDSSHSYRTFCQSVQNRTRSKLSTYIQTLPHCDISVIDAILKHIPSHWVLHIANSTPIRITQWFETRPDLQYFCNRGTSGIDGSVSVASGSAVVSQKKTLLITGDLSFLYDSNGLWNVQFPQNLKIIVLNNGGANIFRMVGDDTIDEKAQALFDASHTVNLSGLCKAYAIPYKAFSGSHPIYTEELKNFFQQEGSAVLEFTTQKEINIPTYLEIFKHPLQ